MNTEEIAKAIDPKGHELKVVTKQLRASQVEVEILRNEVRTLRKNDLAFKFLRSHGVMIETTEGMKYLKDDEFDAFFKGVMISPKLDFFAQAPVRAEGQAISYDEPAMTYEYTFIDKVE
jgi:hypothetical protein